MKLKDFILAFTDPTIRKYFLVDSDDVFAYISIEDLLHNMKTDLLDKDVIYVSPLLHHDHSQEHDSYEAKIILHLSIFERKENNGN